MALARRAFPLGIYAYVFIYMHVKVPLPPPWLEACLPSPRYILVRMDWVGGLGYQIQPRLWWAAVGSEAQGVASTTLEGRVGFLFPG